MNFWIEKFINTVLESLKQIGFDCISIKTNYLKIYILSTSGGDQSIFRKNCVLVDQNGWASLALKLVWSLRQCQHHWYQQ